MHEVGGITLPLTDTELRYYDANVLRLPAEKRKEYHEQVDRLIAELSRSVRDRTEIKITRVVKAGSFAKHTILRRTPMDPVDVDVVFYIAGRSADSETLQTLTDTIHSLLLGIYPSKKVEDFEIGRKAATVTFTGTGLSVDIVPVIEDASRPGYGWQFDLEDGTRMQTCAPCQIQFVRDRKARDSDFRTLVRLAKRWRNQAELKHLKSFPIELLMAHLLDTESANGSIEQRFRRFLLFVAQSELRQRVSFPENRDPSGVFTGPVVVLDPVCDSNNVTARLTDPERVEIVAAANHAWETANFASAEGDLNLWKEVFGPRFKVREEA